MSLTLHYFSVLSRNYLCIELSCSLGPRHAINGKQSGKNDWTSGKEDSRLVYFVGSPEII